MSITDLTPIAISDDNTGHVAEVYAIPTGQLITVAISLDEPCRVQVSVQHRGRWHTVLDRHASDNRDHLGNTWGPQRDLDRDSPGRRLAGQAPGSG